MMSSSKRSRFSCEQGHEIKSRQPNNPLPNHHTSKMDLFAQAARLNNQGVAALLEGDDKAAAATLTQSIKIMKQELSKVTAFDDMTKSAPFSSDDCGHSTTVELPGFHGAQDSYIFTDAINIPEHGDQTVVDLQIYSAAVIFNLALAVHREGNTIGNALSMAKAQKLYLMVLKVLNNQYMNNRVAVIVKLAAINNLSQVRFDCGEYELAREGLHHLSAFMRTSGNTSDAMLEEPKIQGLLMNVLLLKAPFIAPAA
jgi:hypothetical protein